MLSLPLISLRRDVSAGKTASDVLHEPDGTHVSDDQSGEPLVPERVWKARKEGMLYVREMQVYKKIDMSECVRKTGRKPIAVRWVYMNKCDAAQPNDRSRLLAKEFRGNDDRPERFAATSPSERLKLILSKLASNHGHELPNADVRVLLRESLPSICLITS